MLPGARLMSQRCCIECRQFDREAVRNEEASIVRCFEPRKKDGLWNNLVRAGQPACKFFAPAFQTPLKEPTT